MKDYKNYYPSANEKMIADASVIASYTFDGLESQDVFVDGVEKRVFMYDKHSSSQLLKNVISQDDSLTYGDILELENEQKWLILTYDTENILYKMWVTRLCNISLKWIDEFGDIVEFPCVFTNSSSSSYGVNEDKVLILPNGHRQLIIRKTVETIKLIRDTRFIIGGQVYKVVDSDYVGQLGLVVLSLVSDLIDPVNDNMELEIADYFNRLHTYSISIINGSTADLTTGETLQLNVQIKDNDTINDLPVIYTSTDVNIATISSSGLVTSFIDGDATITATLIDHPTVHTSILLSISSIVIDNFTIAITGLDSFNVGQTKSFSIDIRNNGTVDNTKTVVWSLMNDAQTGVTDLASIISQTGTSCSIKGLKYLTPLSSSYVRLIGICVQDGSLVANKRIQVKSIL